MKDQDSKVPIDLGELYDDTDLELMNHVSSIQSKIIKSFDRDDVLNGMSIDKTDSVLRIIDSIDKSINKKAANRLKLKAIDDTNNDRERLLDILTNMKLRERNADVRRGSNIELEEVDVIEANVHIAKGELDVGIEQLSLELLKIEENKEGEW